MDIYELIEKGKSYLLDKWNDAQILLWITAIFYIIFILLS
jgi:hypothetical protein